MWSAEVVLKCRRETFEGRSETLSIGQTWSPNVVKTVADELLREARREADMWQAVDSTLGAIAEAEVVRLERILGAITPERALPRLVPARPKT